MLQGFAITKYYLHILFDVVYHFTRNIFSRRFKIAFGINANNRFGITGTKMHPVILKFNLQPVFSIYRVILILLLYFFEAGLHIYSLLQFYFILTDKIIRISAA